MHKARLEISLLFTRSVQHPAKTALLLPPPAAMPAMLVSLAVMTSVALGPHPAPHFALDWTASIQDDIEIQQGVYNIVHGGPVLLPMHVHVRACVGRACVGRACVRCNCVGGRVRGCTVRPSPARVFARGCACVGRAWVGCTVHGDCTGARYGGVHGRGRVLARPCTLIHDARNGRGHVDVVQAGGSCCSVNSPGCSIQGIFSLDKVEESGTMQKIRSATMCNAGKSSAVRAPAGVHCCGPCLLRARARVCACTACTA